MTVWVWLLDGSAAAGVAFCLYSLWALRGAYSPRFLEDVQPDDTPLPPLTVVVPACNEENRIEKAIRSLLTQSYSSLQVIAVDDRSTDQTGKILTEIAQEDRRLEVIHIQSLPHGWLGKPHALQAGLQSASGEWVLFTDGDVIFEPDVLHRAMLHVYRLGADHLVVFPRPEMERLGERVVTSVFGLLFAIRQKLGGVEDPRSKGHVGAGAFNLFRRRALDCIGGLEPLRLKIVEDVELGRRIKQHGFRQTFLYSHTLLHLRWQVGVVGFIEGLTKNAFAANQFSVGLTLIQISAVILTNVLAPLSILSPTGWAKLCAVPIWIFLFSCYAISQRINGTPPWTALFHPLGALVVAYTLLHSMVHTLRQGGVRWRGTFYPLDMLRLERGDYPKG
jgi:hypothetical protein